MSKTAQKVLAFAAAIVLIFAAGNLSGLYFHARLFTQDEHADDAHVHDPHVAEELDDHAEEEEEDHVALTKQAFENLGLELGTAKLEEYWKSRSVPGEVIEVPGKSDLSIPSPVNGIVERVLVGQGQSLQPTEPIIELRITDEDLTRSQSQLLSTLARQSVVRDEIARLKPLTESGTVSGRSKRDLEYELRQLVADQATRTQEIRARGLPESVLTSIMNNRTLADELTVGAPSFARPGKGTLTRNVSVDAIKQAYYSIENLQVHPGKAVSRGDDLCSLAFHSELYIQGAAFESDLPALYKLAENDWTIVAEFGHQQHARHAHRVRREGLKLLHVDNHVDRQSQTFNFFVPLKNEVEQSITDDLGRTYVQWRFKPGQRVHLNLPEEHWESQLIVPLDAVFVEGANAYVFVEHLHADEHLHDRDDTAHDDDHDDHDHEEIFVELEPVPVRLLHRDSNVAVIANDGQISLDDHIALNHAFKLHLAMEMQAGGGGGGHHHHDH